MDWTQDLQVMPAMASIMVQGALGAGGPGVWPTPLPPHWEKRLEVLGVGPDGPAGPLGETREGLYWTGSPALGTRNTLNPGAGRYCLQCSGHKTYSAFHPLRCRGTPWPPGSQSYCHSGLTGAGGAAERVLWSSLTSMGPRLTGATLFLMTASNPISVMWSLRSWG